ncbi:TIGR02680 family protein [Paenibacillus sp. A3]|uniref:TIGR02680 family protein n=1 Tax=Paenibacillus sp. A3 TaxID=1337054 RepID=UPI00192CEE95|nr:TIGR02680 family protein [Paenibacillus sp. A3]
MKLDISSELETVKQAHTERWQMSRAGIINFWYYDDEEFQLEDGRIILRGTNGSGKSVTMQSFIPLVLDGDKRPERLDPFGSRDRRLEYYLLGEADQGHTDRTGYLWLEFFHTQKHLYKTIGIGIRARRNVAQLGFWGFLLEDGRRINHDFWLYDRNLWVEQGQKVPLNRKVLEERISSGGQVVQEQSAYREMVNKTLFGFHEQDSYKDLLKLLLELRSPKLSKDFKPSSMYEILTNALPPLMEDELSPLSDVMEDLDQITERLDELQKQRTELAKINEKYDNYNRFLLKQLSENISQQFQTFDEILNEVNDYEEKEVLSETEYIDTLKAINKHKERFGTVEAELEVLNRTEAMEKQRELEILEEQLKDLDKHLLATSERLSMNTTRSNKLYEEIVLLTNKINVLSGEQNQILEEMEDMSRITEFREHDIYHGIWLRGVPQDKHWSDNWKQDLESHKKNLASALEIARAEREAFRAAAEAEVKLGDIHRERNLVEEEQALQEGELEDIREEVKEKLVLWHQSLSELSMGGEQLRDSLRSLSLLTEKERQYEPVRRPVQQAFEQQNQKLIQRIFQLQQQKENLQIEYNRIEQELVHWNLTKEPEPLRTDGKRASRQQRDKGKGAPLYAVCEFDASLTANEQAQLEETLAQAGLLDAWISPGGKVEWLDQVNDEEIWIEPDPLQGDTLLNVLYPTPSQESGLSVHDIQMALRSFGWVKDKDEKKNKGITFRQNGSFQFGPLAGTNRSKPRPEYIGKETRLRTKQLEIARLEADMKLIMDQILFIDEGLVEQHKRQLVLKHELESFPDDKDLQVQFDVLIQLSYRLTEVMNQEQKIEIWYKEKMSIWRELQLKLVEQTANWSRVKQEKTIQEAIELSTTYLGLITELYSSWIRYCETKQHQMIQKEQHEELLILLEDDHAQQHELDDKKRRSTAQAVQLRKLILEMGIEEIHLKIKHLKEEKTSLNQQINDLFEKRDQVGQQLAGIKAKLDLYKEQLTQNQSKLNEILERWKTEVKLSLVPGWNEHLMNQEIDEKAIRKLCKQIIKEYGSVFVNMTKDRIANELQQEYNSARSNLQEYVLELEYHESGRIIITSKRDRINPLTPSLLLEELIELENEQRILMTDKDRELYEEIILQSVGKAIRNRIHRAKDWVRKMNELMEQRDTSSGLRLSLQWVAKARKTESELDTEALVELLMRDAHRMDDEEIERVISHFRVRVQQAQQSAQEEQGSLRRYIYDLLDYRSWFSFKLFHRKGGQTGYTELTDSKFNVLSGGEKAMSMYIPLFAATYSRYSDASIDAPKIISLDEAFAGVDDANMRDMFHLLTDMGFDYMMTSQVLWGCYDTVPRLAIYEIHRPRDMNVITLFHYRWNGKRKELVENNV